MKNFFGRVLSTIIGNLATFSIFAIIIVALVFLSTLDSDKPSIKDTSVLEITFNDTLLESDMDNEVSIFSISEVENIYLIDILESIKKAKEDDNIKGISLKIESFQGGLAQAEEIRNALKDFKKSGKFIYAYSNNASQTSYYLSSVADKIYQNPLGGVLLQGMSSEVMFFKNAGDKYGIDFQIIRYGDYKSAVEPFFRTDLSDANKLQLNVLLQDIWGNISKEISTERKLAIQDFNTVVDSLYAYIPEIGQKNKIYDQIIHEAEYEDILFKKLGLKSSDKKTNFEILEKHTININDYFESFSSDEKNDKVAILYASGEITEGDGFDGIQSKTYVKAIREIEKNKKVKALVIRVNSPGGSANASEEILFELSRLKTKMPIVVSFGDVAASGGYYIAQNSDKIFAQNNTITGSIGVFGMIPNAQKLANNIGITTDGVKTNANSDQLKSIFKPISTDTEKLMTKSVAMIYQKFVNHVARNRKMNFDQVDKLGGGRVWSGIAAKQNNLVDEIGGLNDAINYAAKLAKLDSYSPIAYPKRKDSFEELIDNLQSNSIKNNIKKEIGTETYDIVNKIKTLNNQKGAQVRLPFDLKIQ